MGEGSTDGRCPVYSSNDGQCALVEDHATGNGYWYQHVFPEPNDAWMGYAQGRELHRSAVGGEVTDG